jgi:hypothetical protein
MLASLGGSLSLSSWGSLHDVGFAALPRISLRCFARSESFRLLNVRLQLRAIGEVVALVACSLVLHSLLRTSVGTVGSKNRDPLVVLPPRTSRPLRSLRSPPAHSAHPSPRFSPLALLQLLSLAGTLLLLLPPGLDAHRLRLVVVLHRLFGLVNACGPPAYPFLQQR